MSSEVVMADVMTTPRVSARGIKWLICVLSAIVACGAHPKRKPTTGDSTAIVRPATISDHLIALLPPNPQLVVEVDLARLRGNPVVGPLVVRLLGPAESSGSPALPMPIRWCSRHTASAPRRRRP